MTDEMQATDIPNEQAEAPEVEAVYVGEQPTEDLKSYLEVAAKATVKDGDDVSGFKSAKGFFRFGADIDEAVELYGAEIIFTNYRAQAKIKCQSLMRSHILQGKDVGDLLSTWKPGMMMERTPVDPMVAAENKFDSLSEEEQEAFLAKLIAKQQG